MDLASVGFSADTTGLKELQAELAATKAKADETAASFQRLQASGQNSGPAFTAAKQAAADYQTALGNVIDKQLATGNATGAMESIVKNSNSTWAQASTAINAAIAFAHRLRKRHQGDGRGNWRSQRGNERDGRDFQLAR